jgi:hypothetical protein
MYPASKAWSIFVSYGKDWPARTHQGEEKRVEQQPMLMDQYPKRAVPVEKINT